MSTMKHVFDTVYPPLHERTPMPSWFLPSCLAITVLPLLFPRSRPFLVVNTTLLTWLCLQLPYYTFGDPASDYYNSGPVFALLPWYLDFVVFTPWAGGDALVFTGARGPQRLEAQHNVWQRLGWAMRLMLPAQRGIGWNWQVKGVPKHPYAKLPAWQSAVRHLAWATFYYAQSVVYLIILGWSLTCEQEARSWIARTLATGLVSWSGAAWIWVRLACAYSTAASLSIAVRLFDPWEWPPLMGSLSEAWSVRQMWSAVYHQQMRRLLARPTIGVTRLLAIKKGNPLSGHVQLVVTFTISCLFHQLQMYNACRKTAGELAFFMAQPIAIELEDVVQKLYGSTSKQMSRPHARRAGYIWVVAWFAFSTHPYIRGLYNAGIVDDWLLAKQPLALGASIFHRGTFWVK